MGKRSLTPALTFAPGSNTLNLSGIPNFDLRNLYAVINLTAGGALVYAPMPGYTATAAGTTLTLSASLTGMAATDKLMVVYDDGGSGQKPLAMKMFRATAPGTGYVAGDYLASVSLVDGSSGTAVLASGVWLNLSQQAVLPAAPASGTYIGDDQIVGDSLQNAINQTALYQTNSYQALLNILAADRVFAPIVTSTIAILAGATATATPVKLPAMAAGTVDSYRVRNAAKSAGTIHWTLSTDSTKKPIAPVPYDTTGANSNAAIGDKGIDPGGVEVIRLTDAQIAALTAGTLYLAALAPLGDANTVLSITFGQGAN